MSNVLVVHPDSGFAQSVVAALAEAGIQAISVPDGERAIDRFVQEPASAIVVDVTLPGRDGAATVESIRWAPGGAKVPVVLTCTADNAGQRLTETGRRLGVTTMTAAGERDPRVVAAAVRRALAAHASAPPAAATAAPAQQAAPTAERPLPTPQATTSQLHVGDAVQEDEDSLPPQRILPTIARPEGSTTGSGRDRVTVASKRPRSGDDEVPALSPDSGDRREADDVARAQREITPGAAALNGDLADLPFPRLLAKLAEERATGALVVVARDDDPRVTTTGEAPKKVVYFRVGVPVYVKSNLVRETLGEILARASMIDRATHDEAVSHMRAGEGRLGGILLAMGAIAPRDLREALAEQLRTKLFDLFSWETGVYRFSRRVQPPPEVVTLELGLPEIVFEGVTRKVAPHKLLSLLAPQADKYVVPSPGANERFASLDLVPEARVALRSIDGTRTLRDIGTVAGKRPAAAAQIVYAMECLGVVRFTEAPEKVAIDEPSTPHDVTGPLAMPLDTDSAREELQRVMLAVRERRFADALSRPRDLAAAETEAARLVARYSPLLEPGVVPREVRALATEVCLRLSRARDEGRLLDNDAGVPMPAGMAPMLPHTTAAALGVPPTWEEDTYDSEEHARDAYHVGAGLLSPQSGPAPAPVPGAATPVDEAAPDDADGDAPRPPTVPPPRPPSASSPRPPTVPPPRAARKAAAAAPKADDTGPASARQRSHLLGPPPALPRDPPTDAIDPAKLDERVAKLADAERHFRRGERMLAKDKLAEAITAFEKAAELVPDEGEFLASLAWARFRASPDDAAVVDAALEILAEAARFSPKLARAHLLRGHVLKAKGDVAAAREAYEAAVAASPDTTDALEALKAMS